MDWCRGQEAGKLKDSESVRIQVRLKHNPRCHPVRSFYPLWIALVLFMTNVLFSTKEMEDWSIDDLAAFARNSGLDDEDVAILKKQKIVRKAFMKESYEFFRDWIASRIYLSSPARSRQVPSPYVCCDYWPRVTFFAHVILFLSFQQQKAPQVCFLLFLCAASCTYLDFHHLWITLVTVEGKFTFQELPH